MVALMAVITTETTTTVQIKPTLQAMAVSAISTEITMITVTMVVAATIIIKTMPNLLVTYDVWESRRGLLRLHAQEADNIDNNNSLNYRFFWHHGNFSLVKIRLKCSTTFASSMFGSI